MKILIITSLLLIPVESIALTLVWDPVQNDDILCYKVYWGRESGRYTNSKYVGKETQYKITFEDSVVYYITVTAIDMWGNESNYGSEIKLIGGVSEPVDREDSAALSLYPNPAQTHINIQFNLEKRQNVYISVYNIMGQKVTTLIEQSFSRGSHTVHWNRMSANGGLAAAGIYYCRIRTDSQTTIQKITLL
ncbi:MAG: T9SS type A sorting domain-containing protein [candidate division KSB1 bacterium]|nr:T9SS type A sorting domain-containing protein [candidate division KSB1 bacterium]